MDTIYFIGIVHSPLKHVSDCPLQESEGAPQVTISIESACIDGLHGLQRGDKIVILTWLHRSDRTVLKTKPRNNPDAETLGVFATRSPDRPNPIGMHIAEILDINDRGNISISSLEAIDGTPVIDIKPVI
jgi:tRNA-Thr(GGU) m(6)t(6)A37 methyltransferase TsaA